MQIMHSLKGSSSMKCLKTSTALFILLLSCLGSVARAAQDPLMQGFEYPPENARPRVWWHWMNGNITKQGIDLDLEWMKSVGLGGFTQLDIGFNTPQVVQKRLVYMSPGWKDAFRFAETTGHKYGFDMTIGSAPGWGETGGPWVPPAQGMKKMVWSEIQVEGGETFSGTLPLPPKATGLFQDYEMKAEASSSADKVTPPLPQFYADSAVVAYRLPSDERAQGELHPEISSSGGTVDVPALSDGNVNKVALRLPAAEPGGQAWIQFKYSHPQTIQSVTLASLDDMISIFDFFNPNARYPELEESDDGAHFHSVAQIPPSSIPQRTVSFPATTASFFRVTFPTPSTTEKREDHLISELSLSGTARVNEFEKRAGFAVARDYYAVATPPASPGSVVLQKDVIDLTSQVRQDGFLTWTPPAGKWVILRIGYSLIGRKNGPAPAEATGLEVDKLNRQDVHNYMEGYLRMYSAEAGVSRLGKGGIGSLLTDSVEVGAQNWTDNILTEFRRLRGYDPHPWLPALTGVIIQSPEDSTKFLWDFRRTIAELLAENHYGEIAQDLHRHGMQYHSEALEYHRPSLGDDMEMRRHADIPMGAMWTFPQSGAPAPTYIADLRGAASVSHIYGQNLVAAESMTSNGPAWGYAPDSLKMIADLEFDLGVNQLDIHESAHQPLVSKAPGLTLGPYGLWFNRNQTWAAEAGPWVSYLARCSYMLQQGHFVGDVAYFYGQEGPITAVFGFQPQQDAPHGYGFDFVNSDVILNQLSVKDGRLVTTAGASYRILYLGGESSKMTLPVLRRLRDLVMQGAVVVGRKPDGSPSLADSEAEFDEIADQMWGSDPEPPASGHPYGKGKVYSGQSAEEVLAKLHVARDFTYARPEPDTEIMFVHRHLRGGDLYFVDNRKDRSESVDAIFRIDGRVPELWYPDTGKTEPASYRSESGLTTVPLHLDPYGAVFVVFRKPAALASRSIPVPKEMLVSTLPGAWRVSFPSGRGAPASVTLETLTSWSESSDSGVRYFSGTSTYTKTFQASPAWFKHGAHLWLDLGEVKNLADVRVNDKPLGILWKSPYRVDATKALRPGENHVSIKVTNLWVNRLIGDQQPNASRKYTFTDVTPYSASSPLLPSGLLGPASIMVIGKE